MTPMEDRSFRGRLAAVRIAFLLFFGLLGYRLCMLAGDDGARARARAEAQTRSRVDVSAAPGAILARRLVPFALTVPSWSIYAEPRRVPDPEKAAIALGELLDRNPEEIESRLRSRRAFAWIQRHIGATTAQDVAALAIPGIGLREESVRVYPQGSLLGATVGFSGSETQGLAGLERSLGRSLSAKPAQDSVRRDARGRLLAVEGRDLLDPAEGASAILTIDGRIQAIAEEEVAAAAAKHNPKGAVAIVLEPASGEILAVAAWPPVDPSRPLDGPGNALANPAAVMTFEPGSVFKPFTAAAAIEDGRVTPDTVFDCNGGTWNTGRGRVLHDSHPRGGVDRLTVTDIISKSSNVGIAKVGLTLGGSRLPAWIRKFGFGTRTGAGLPGEEPGKVTAGREWGFFTMTSVPMGQEIAVTPLQLARGFACFANGGRLVDVRLVKELRAADGTALPLPAIRAKRILSEATARKVTRMLVSVVEEGTGKSAAVPGVSVAGKTGTAQKAERGGYSHSKFIGTFCGFAPAEAPRLLVLVTLDEPKNGYYGGTVSAPAVGKILARALPLVGFEPSRIVEARVQASPGAVRITAASAARPAASKVSVRPAATKRGASARR